MKVEIKIPPSGESVLEATIATILKQEGSFVTEGEEIVEIETDKVNQVVYAPKSGRISWQVEVGKVVKIGEVVGFIDVEAATNSETSREQGFIKEEAKEKKEILTEKKSSEGERREKMTGLRKLVAKRLVGVMQETAMLTTFNEVDMSFVIEIKEKKKEEFLQKYQVKLGFVSFFAKASSFALQKYPKLNAFLDKEEIVYHDFCDLGIAVSTEKGLMVPVIKKAETLSLSEMEKKLKDFAERARGANISVDLLKGGTFTITNGGVFGSLFSTPLLNPPQSAILGMHAIQKRAVVVGEKIEIRPMMYLALSYDHRIIDGQEAIQFLKSIKDFLEDPGLEKNLFP